MDTRLLGDLFATADSNQESRLNDLVTYGKWREQFTEQQGLLISFVRAWAKYTSKTLANVGVVPWNSIEGYADIVQRLMTTISNMEIAVYSHKVLNAVCAFIRNERLLSPIMELILSRVEYIHSDTD